MKIVAIIITFNPNLDQLKNNIASIISQVDEVIIVDNGSNNQNVFNDLLSELGHFTLILNADNLGIAEAQNIGMAAAAELEASWSLILDQDSLYPTSGIESIESILERREYLNRNIGLLSPVYVDRNWDGDFVAETGSITVPVDFPIASGSLISMRAWKKVGGFDSQLFIDRVDDDFDLRLREAGFELLQVNAIQMEHSIGNISEVTIFGHKIQIFNHSAFRKYYQARNSILFAKKHGSWMKEIFRINVLLLKTAVFEKQKLQKTIKIFSGVKNGILNR